MRYDLHMATTTASLTRIAARASIVKHSEIHDRSRLADDSHDLLSSVLDLLAENGIELPDPTSKQTAEEAWL